MANVVYKSDGLTSSLLFGLKPLMILKLKKKIHQLHIYLKSTSPVLYICIMVVFSYFLTIIFSPLFEILSSIDIDGKSLESASTKTFYNFFKFVLIGPLIETLIFQLATIEILKLITNKNKYLILISSFLFSLSHYYNVGYLVHALIMGFLFAYSYLLFDRKSTAFIVVYAIHLLRNLVAFFI